MDPFLGEIRLFSFGFPPRGWLPCNGQLLAVASNQALFALLGIQFGGNGQSTFGLPDLRGQSPLGAQLSARYPQGAVGGEAAHALIPNEMPTHSHGSTAAPQASLLAPAGNHLAGPGKAAFAAPGSGGAVTMAAATVSTVGSSQAHENRPPFLTLNFCIATSGIWPSRS